MMTIGLHSKCDDTAWAVLLATAQFFEEENRLKDKSGHFVWEAEGVATARVEGTPSAAGLTNSMFQHRNL